SGGPDSDQPWAIGGSTGCNNFGGEVRQADEGVLDVVELANTEMACVEPEGVMAQEARFLDALRAVATYELDDNRLRLLDQAGQPRLSFQRKLETASDPTALIGRGWQLTSIGNDAPQADRPITLIFQDARRFSGQSDCRSFLGTYQADAHDIAFTSLSMLGEIEPACQPEELYLPGNGDYRLTADSLAIIPDRGPAFHYEPLPSPAADRLAGSSWRLLARTEVIDPAPRDVVAVVPGTEITLQFDDEQISGSAGCNGYGASYEQQAENELTFAVAEATAMGCLEPEGIMAQEQAYLAALTGVQRYSIDGPHLWLSLADGGALLYTRMD
ncbi:MAG: META domain-containing protein, partial [Candidatus Promineifilaceae bacterium]|nr:META domain-containing protein [Candidatus Promineifilaceae bacterium]